LHAKGNQFAAKLNGEFQSKSLNLRVANFASIFWIHQAVPNPIRSLKDIPSTHGPGFKKVFHGALERGVYLAPSGYEVGFLGAAHTPAVLDEAIVKIVAAAEAAASA
jgi:glutamate-1-semialdehyde 2,1-aminomutase